MRVLVHTGRAKVYGHGERPWDAVVDALSKDNRHVNGVAIDWDAAESDKWNACSGHVYVGPKLHERIGRWERVHPAEGL